MRWLDPHAPTTTKCPKMTSGQLNLLVLGTLLFFLLPSSRADCAINFLHLHNKCYYFSDDVESWSNSHFRCEEMNSTLITLRSKYNVKKLTQYLLKDHLERKEWWIGANYDWVQKKWKWGASGKPVKFNHFVHNLVNTKLDWHCAFLDERQQYKWNAEPCTRKKYYICMQNLLDYNETENDKDNEIPLIVSRDLLEEDHLKNNNNNIEPGLLQAKGQKHHKPHQQHRIVCPKGYGHVRNSCYKFSKTQATWQEAYFICAAEPNGTLAVIPDRKYDRGIRKYAKRIGATVHERWISGIYDWQKTAWKWASNGIVIQHQEKDKELLRWHCLIWSPLITNKWTSDSCVIMKHFICQTQPQIFVPMEMKRWPGSEINRKYNFGLRGKNKYDYEAMLEFRTNATHRHQIFNYKPL